MMEPATGNLADMEGSESERTFDSLNLNPQLFINEVRNAVDDMFDGAFDFYQQKALSIVGDQSKDKVDELTKGIFSMSSVIQEVLDRRLDMWEKYCLQHCFTVPKGFLPPKADKSDDNLMDLDVFWHGDLDIQLDSLREKLFLANKEGAELQKELDSSEQSILSNKRQLSIIEAAQLFEDNSAHAMLHEMLNTAIELREKMENLRTKRTAQLQQSRIEGMHCLREDYQLMHQKNEFFDAELEDVQHFADELKKI